LARLRARAHRHDRVIELQPLQILFHRLVFFDLGLGERFRVVAL